MVKEQIVHSNPLEKCLSKISRYHHFVFFLIFLCKVPLVWHILNLIFLSPHMDFTCDGIINKCPCDNPTWNLSVFEETMQTKFSIYCDNNWLMYFANSMAFFGALLGCLFFGFLSDKFGRLFIASVSYFVVGTAGCLVAVMPNIYGFTVMRFLEGIGVGGGIVTTFVYCIEFCSVENREIVTALFHIPINIGHLSIPGVSYLIRNMDKFQMAISIPMFFFSFYKWILMESPKWLMDNDHTEKLMKGLKKICPDRCATIKEDIEAYKAQQTEQGKQKVKFWQIFKHKRLTLNFGCMAVNYFVCGMGYYGVYQFIGTMAGDIHLNVAISGLLVFPGTIMCIFLLKLFSRRNFLMVTNLLAGLFMIGVVSTPASVRWVRVAFACIANCFFFMTFIIAFLYGVELFPTSVRNSVLGVLSVLSRVGQILVPPINSLSEVAAGSIFGVMAIIGALMCIPLPETKNVELPSSLEETKRLSQKDNSRRNTEKGPRASGSKPNE